MAPKIFISYRRGDSAGEAGRIGDRIVAEFGRAALFMDVDSIPLGANFVQRLTEEVARCDVVLAVIGPRWLDISGENGRRIDDPNDFVRVEIAAALRREIPVIPILLDGVRIPRADLLPEDVKPLTVRHGLSLRHTSFQSDLGALISELKRIAPRSTRKGLGFFWRRSERPAKAKESQGLPRSAPEPLFSLVVSALGILAAAASVLLFSMLTREVLKIWFPEGEGNFPLSANMFRQMGAEIIYPYIAGGVSLAALALSRHARKIFWLFVGSFSYFLVHILFTVITPSPPWWTICATGMVVSIGIFGILTFVRRAPPLRPL